MIRFKWFALFIAFISILGCGPKKEVHPIENNRVSYLFQRQSLENGYAAFFRGDFEQASALFKAVQQGSDSVLSKKASFAFVCTQLILADTSKEFEAAEKQIEALADSEPVPLGYRELNLLSALLKRITQLDQNGNESKTKLDATCAYQYQESIKLKDDMINKQKQRIKTLKDKVKTLKNKIKSIEEIDQKIQQKKIPYQHRK